MFTVKRCILQSILENHNNNSDTVEVDNTGDQTVEEMILKTQFRLPGGGRKNLENLSSQDIHQMILLNNKVNI
jgi:hypothetical protein